MKQKILVYSWTGNTAACAVALGEQLNAEVELILEQKEREGSSGFAKGGFFASVGLSSKLKTKPQTEGVDVLLIGMPVWASTTPPAINAFFKEAALSGKRVYAFATQQSEQQPQKLENKLKKLITKRGGKFMHLFVLRVPHKQQLSVEACKSHTAKWAERIKSQI